MARPDDPHRFARSLAVVALVVLASFVGVAAAQETRTGGTVVVGPDETVRGDLTVASGTLVVRGTVDGDLSAFSGDVLVAGTVTGDVQAFAGNVRVTGEVGQNLEAFGGNVALDGGTVGGDLEAAAGNVRVDGTVDGSARVGAETLTLGPSADVGGDLVYDAGTFTRHPDAVVGGSITQTDDVGVSPPVAPGRAAGSVYSFLVNLLLGVVLLAVFPAFSRRVADRATDAPLLSGAAGLLVLVGIPVLLVLLVVTIVGIPLALAGVLLFGLLLWVAWVYGGFAVGTWLLSLADVDQRWAALLVGLLAVALLSRVPLLGGLVALVVLLVGLGAVGFGVGRTYSLRGGRPAVAAD